MDVDVKAQREITGELFHLTQLVTDITEKTDAQCENFAIRYTYAPIWLYQVPVGQELILLPEHRVSIYIEDDEVSPAEWANNEHVRVEVWDADLRRMQIALQCRYITAKEEQDLDKMAHLEILQPLRLRAGDWIYICGYCPHTIYTIDVSDSRFSLEVIRVKPSMFTY